MLCDKGLAVIALDEDSRDIAREWNQEAEKLSFTVGGEDCKNFGSI